MALNEKKWWSSHVKPAWTSPSKKWLANKVQDAFNAGLPDVDALFNGVAAKIELKYASAWPVRPDTKLTFSKDKVSSKYCIASPAQVRQLMAWHNCGGDAYVLIGIGKEWFLLEATTLDGEFNWGMVQAEIRHYAVCHGESYQDLVKIPQYLEAAHNG